MKRLSVLILPRLPLDARILGLKFNLALSIEAHLLLDAEILDLLQRVEVVLEQHLGVGDRVLCADEDERDGALLARDGRRRLVVALDLDPHDPTLVDDFLDEATVLADDFADE